MGLTAHIRHHVVATTSPSPPSPLSPLAAALDWSRCWGERAQERARRNAMVATNDLLARRREHEDVEDFLALATARRHAAAGHRDRQARHHVGLPPAAQG